MQHTKQKARAKYSRGGGGIILGGGAEAAITDERRAAKLLLSWELIANAIDNFPYRLIFVLDKSRPKKLHSRKEPFKSSEIPKLGPYKVCKFSHYCVTCENCYHFRLKYGSNSARNTIMRKFANFVRLYFPYFTRFRDQILKFCYF